MKEEKDIKKNGEGLSYEELVELLKYIEENHSWKNMFENHCNANMTKAIKYVDFKMDTRDCKIWYVEFYDIINSGNIDKKVFRTEMNYNLKEEIYRWLKEDKK